MLMKGNRIVLMPGNRIVLMKGMAALITGEMDRGSETHNCNGRPLSGYIRL